MTTITLTPELKAAVVAQARERATTPREPGVYPAWKALVRAAGVAGGQAHDARLVAIHQVCGITHFLTFNVAHFTRPAAYVPGLIVADPEAV